jgi:hypothetical protein
MAGRSLPRSRAYDDVNKSRRIARRAYNAPWPQMVRLFKGATSPQYDRANREEDIMAARKKAKKSKSKKKAKKVAPLKKKKGAKKVAPKKAKSAKKKAAKKKAAKKAAPKKKSAPKKAAAPAKPLLAPAIDPPAPAAPSSYQPFSPPGGTGSSDGNN